MANEESQESAMNSSKNIIATCKDCGGRIWLDKAGKHKCEDWRPVKRCEATSGECGQCELKLGHDGKHLAGYLMWSGGAT